MCLVVLLKYSGNHQFKIQVVNLAFMPFHTDFVRNFSVSNFSMVMGTGAVALSTYLMGKDLSSPPLISLSIIIGAGNFILLSILIILFLVKLTLYPQMVRKDFEDPLKTNFHMTLGISMLVVSSTFSEIISAFPLSLVLWFLGSFLIIITEMLAMFVTFLGHHIKLEHINPSWFLGATGLLLIPGTGIFFLKFVHIHNVALFLFDLSFGAGFFLYLALIGASLISLSSYYYFLPRLGGVCILLNYLLLGLGMWWLFLALIVTFYYIKKVGVSYTTAWWSITFPLGQFLIGIYRFNELVSHENLHGLLMALFILLLILWILNAILTIGSLNSKRY